MSLLLDDKKSSLGSFLETIKFPGELIFAKIWGSRSHNTQIETSDWDFSGVYRVPLNNIIGLKSYPETLTNTEGTKPDYSFHEIGKFSRLLLTGNPGILEMLFTEDLCFVTESWIELKKNRKDFLTKQAVRNYLGYAEGQLRALISGKKNGLANEKPAYHLIRVLNDARRIVEGNEPVVVKSGKELEFLMKIRHNQVSRDEIEFMSEKEIYDIKILVESCKLPEKGNEIFLDNWLQKVRLTEIVKI